MPFEYQNIKCFSLFAEVRKLNVIAQKRHGRPKKTWDEVLVDNKKKLGMDSADPQNPF